MKKDLFKKITLLGIKYGPSLMALTCCAKILLINISTAKLTPVESTVNYINIALNTVITIILYCAGKYFNFCWRHSALCRTAIWGYIFYFFFLTFNIKGSYIIGACACYVIVVLIMTVTYKLLENEKETNT